MAKNIIDDFRGEHWFLSNFFTWPIQWYMEAFGSKERWEGVANTVEHAFQAAKARYMNDWDRVMGARTPGEAKRCGRNLQLRPDWEEIKRGVMSRALKLKFADPLLQAALLGTGDDYLVEGNTWHDNVWGSCQCGARQCGNGENLLGVYLMNLRDDIRNGRQ